MECPRCNTQTQVLVNAPEGTTWPRVCKSCARFLWIQHDHGVGLEVPAGISSKSVQKTRRKRNQPTERHIRVAQIAQSLGVNITAEDMKKIYSAERIEYEERTQRPAAGGRARHDVTVWPGLAK